MRACLHMQAAARGPAAARCSPPRPSPLTHAPREVKGQGVAHQGAVEVGPVQHPVVVCWKAQQARAAPRQLLNHHQAAGAGGQQAGELPWVVRGAALHCSKRHTRACACACARARRRCELRPWEGPRACKRYQQAHMQRSGWVGASAACLEVMYMQ